MHARHASSHCVSHSRARRRAAEQVALLVPTALVFALAVLAATATGAGLWAELSGSACVAGKAKGVGAG